MFNPREVIVNDIDGESFAEGIKAAVSRTQSESDCLYAITLDDEIIVGCKDDCLGCIEVGRCEEKCCASGGSIDLGPLLVAVDRDEHIKGWGRCQRDFEADASVFVDGAAQPACFVNALTFDTGCCSVDLEQAVVVFAGDACPFTRSKV